MDKERRLEESWTANALAWTELIRSGGIESRVVVTNAAVLEAVLEGGPRSVLDVGCGEGWLAHRLADAGIDVTGFDASEPLIRHAREGTRGTFHVLDYDAFAAHPLRLGERFDTVVCNFSLLGADIQGLLRATAEVMSPPGKLVIQTVHPLTSIGDQPYADGWREERFEGMGGGFAASMPWYFRTVGSWIRELGGAGLRIDDCREPAHPETGTPLSLIWIATRAGH